MLQTLQQMGQGFVSALTWINLLAMVGGVSLGIVIGCLPGLSAAMGVALMLPLTFTMPADTGLIVLGAIYCGAIFGGSISAILIHKTDFLNGILMLIQLLKNLHQILRNGLIADQLSLLHLPVEIVVQHMDVGQLLITDLRLLPVLRVGNAADSGFHILRQ